MNKPVQFTCNQRVYQCPERPLVVICIDGCADEYLDASLVRDRMPRLAVLIRKGFRGMARGALPSFTNVNNASIVTGVPPAVHGISGNYFYDSEKDQEVMMNSSTFLRTETILACAARAGRKVGMVTAKEKLRDILSHKLDGIAFSSEKANQARLESHGIDEVESCVGHPTPAIYSADASLFVLRAGVALIEKGLSDFLYLSLTDFMQHTYPPEALESLDFYQGIDFELGKLLDLGAVVGLTADHGMNDKRRADGSPNVVYLESDLETRFGTGFRVILPITDPYVLHHGALGSFAVIYVPTHLDATEVHDWLLRRPEITEVYPREIAAEKLELPLDRIGDFVAMSRRDVVLGRTPAHHDLSQLKAGLRSHGGRYEEMVPFLLSEPLSADYKAKASGDLRNFDIFEFTTHAGQNL